MAKRQPKRNAKQGRVRESEKHKEDEAEMESEDEDAEGHGDGGGADGDHDDKNQDVKLIKKMIGEYVGDGAKSLSKDEHEALHSLGKEAMMAHKEMGKKEDEAYKCAGEAVKLAHHMACKKKESEDEHESEDEGDMPPPKKKAKPAPPSHDDDDGGDDDDDGDSSESEDEGKHESEDEGKKESKRERVLHKKLLEAEGRLAALENRSRKADLEIYVDKKLKESKQSNATTKRFREAAGDFKTKSDFDVKWKIFLEASKGFEQAEDADWSAMIEKASTDEDGNRSVGSDSIGFGDCADQD